MHAAMETSINFTTFIFMIFAIIGIIVIKYARFADASFAVNNTNYFLTNITWSFANEQSLLAY